ncbi:glycosyltransferase family 4 protein [Kocuria rosea]|uniref:glycosyltransferase family 4 protein n=1 Tax=Kocuria rosea TaxID=1275 RepID=UPI0025B7558C|nr:glycosyltransferase family 4 protein [Kocuria rosea]WJZ65501.1 glycosyltransferase family 4 protein [Kocuria rosea]
MVNENPLRVLIVSLHYAPERTGNAPYTAALARGLVNAGSSVEVITSYPFYPEWCVKPGYYGRRMEETIDGVRVRRYRHYVPIYGGTGWRRLLMELHFGFRAVFTKWGDHDIVLAVSPALFSTFLVLLKACILKVPSGLWIQDLYSKGLKESAQQSRLIADIMLQFEGLVFRLPRGLAVIHPRFASFVRSQFGIDTAQIAIIRNWTHLAVADVPLDRSTVRSARGWTEKDIVVLHAGNMGMKQGLENVVNAAAMAEAQSSNIRFVLLGGGSRRATLEEASRGFVKLEFMDLLPDDEYMAVLHSADILLVNEQPGLKEMSVPSKLTSYFHAGLPIIAAVESDGVTAEEITAARAGIVVRPGRPQELLDAVVAISSDIAFATQLGRSGQRYARDVLTEEAAVRHFVSWLARLFP